MTDGQPRPEVVQAIFDALCTLDGAYLAGLTDVTPTERERAQDLWIAAELAASERRNREVEVWDVLITRQWERPPTWAQFFDELTPERVDRLRELYDALPAGARGEFDRRYGRPDLSGDGG